MATISVQTKKFADLEAILSVTGTEQMLIHDGNGVKVITVQNLHKGLQADIDAIQNVIADGAGAHNSIYRGKNLGTSVTAEQYKAISDGTFAGLYVGDYWVISGVTYRIAGFDYYLHNGDTDTTKHHAVIVPDENMGFVINERGKTRPITGEQIRDRIAKHSLCDEVLTPAIKDHLIYDNGASQKGKGIDFTRRRLEAHLHRFFRENQSNDGYILLMDFSKYYDNIRHDKLMELFEKYVDDDTALWFLEKIVDNEKVDVSYMSDEEYASAMDDVFNSLEHEKVDKSLLTGKKFLRKHLNIGDQVAQDAGIAYPIPIDNYIKIVKGVKFYGRYMDDSYVIHKDKEFLKGLLIEIVEIAHDLGITVNLRKTRICKLSEMWRFLQIQYSLTDTGRVIHKIHPKRLTGMRRKAKKLVLILSEKDFDDWFRSWFNGHCHYMSKLQRSNMLDLCKKLKEEHYYGKTDFS